MTRGGKRGKLKQRVSPSSHRAWKSGRPRRIPTFPQRRRRLLHRHNFQTTPLSDDRRLSQDPPAGAERAVRAGAEDGAGDGGGEAGAGGAGREQDQALVKNFVSERFILRSRIVTERWR